MLSIHGCSNEEMLKVLHQRCKLIPSTIIKFPPELNSKGPSIHKMICEPSGNRIGFAYTPAK
jgi:lactoylglutathione lyase